MSISSFIGFAKDIFKARLSTAPIEKKPDIDN
jgi:hypothetical protein